MLVYSRITRLTRSDLRNHFLKVRVESSSSGWTISVAARCYHTAVHSAPTGRLSGDTRAPRKMQVFWSMRLKTSDPCEV